MLDISIKVLVFFYGINYFKEAISDGVINLVVFSLSSLTKSLLYSLSLTVGFDMRAISNKILGSKQS